MATRIALVSTWLVVSSIVQAAPERRETDDSVVPAGEGRHDDVAIELPVVPSFALPAPAPDGARTVRELRVAGTRSLGTQIAVKGVITWVYDCVTDIRRAGESDRQVHARIDLDPTLCERPKFYVGDARDTPPEQSLWVVDVPRNYNKLELERMSKDERNLPDRCEPGDTTRRLCPPYKVGDVVLVVGTFATSSPHSERDSDGLLVYAAMRNDTQHWETTGGVAIPAAAPHAPIVHPKASHLPAPPSVATRKVVAANVRDESTKHLATANRAFAEKRWTDAIAEYQSATAVWDDNHLAWYGLGGAFATTGDWTSARDAFAHAATLRPDAAMYHLWLGVAAYEAAVKDARGINAVVDYQAIDFTLALTHLAEAVRIDDTLWRAHYYLGRIHRAYEEPRNAAVEFTAAIKRNPHESNPYVALAVLYEKWDYTDLAIAVADQGTRTVTGDTSDLWYEMGMGYAARKIDDKAIEAFTQALATRHDNANASFQRAQVYFRDGDFAHAKSDLETFAKTNAPGLDLARRQAQAMLLDIAAKSKPRRSKK